MSEGQRDAVQEVTPTVTVESNGETFEIDFREVELREDVPREPEEGVDYAVEYKYRCVVDMMANAIVDVWPEDGQTVGEMDVLEYLDRDDVELQDIVHIEKTKLDEYRLRDLHTDKIIPTDKTDLAYKKRIFEKYGRRMFKLRGWQQAILASENQTSLRRWMPDDDDAADGSVRVRRGVFGSLVDELKRFAAKALRR